MKKIVILWISLALLLAGSMAGASDHRHHGHKHQQKHQYHQHHAIKKQHHRHHHGGHHDEAGYFLGGLFVGALLNEHNQVYLQHRRHYPGPVYYRDRFGGCFEVQQRGRREILIEVPIRFCR